MNNLDQFWLLSVHRLKVPVDISRGQRQRFWRVLWGRSLGEDIDFADLSLVCGDEQQIEAHMVILASSSPFVQNMLMNNEHSHPLMSHVANILLHQKYWKPHLNARVKSLLALSAQKKMLINTIKNSIYDVSTGKTWSPFIMVKAEFLKAPDT